MIALRGLGRAVGPKGTKGHPKAEANSLACQLSVNPGVQLAGSAEPAFALSEGRVYEMVSPVYKGGFGVGGSADTQSGRRRPMAKA